MSILTRHTEIIWISDEQRIANAFVRFAIATRSYAAETILTLLLAPSGDTDVRRGTRGRARTSVRPTRASGKRVSDETFAALARGPLRRHYALRVVAANVSFARCNRE